MQVQRSDYLLRSNGHKFGHFWPFISLSVICDCSDGLRRCEAQLFSLKPAVCCCVYVLEQPRVDNSNPDPN